MTQLRRILCATDFSPASTPAWAFARRLARATGAEIDLVHVVPLIPVPLDGAFDAATYQRLLDDDRKAAVGELARLVQEAGDPAPRVQTLVEDGPPAMRIVQVAEREAADLLVVGTHGRSGLNRLLVGSIAESVLHLAKCPVVTVRPLPAPVEGLRPGLARILYPTDFSPASKMAWSWARALAEATGAHVEVLHVMLEAVPDRHLDPVFLAETEAAIRASAQRSADHFLDGCGLPRDRVSVHLAHGVEADQITHRAAARRADLVVMGTHGRTGIFRLALGSVARRVLHAAPCPVLTVGPEARDR